MGPGPALCEACHYHTHSTAASTLTGNPLCWAPASSATQTPASASRGSTPPRRCRPPLMRGRMWSPRRRTAVCWSSCARRWAACVRASVPPAGAGCAAPRAFRPRPLRGATSFRRAWSGLVLCAGALGAETLSSGALPCCLQVKYKEAQRYRDVSAAQAAARPAQAAADRLFRRVTARPGGEPQRLVQPPHHRAELPSSQNAAEQCQHVLGALRCITALLCAWHGGTCSGQVPCRQPACSCADIGHGRDPQCALSLTLPCRGPSSHGRRRRGHTLPGPGSPAKRRARRCPASGAGGERCIPGWRMCSTRDGLQSCCLPLACCWPMHLARYADARRLLPACVPCWAQAEALVFLLHPGRSQLRRRRRLPGRRPSVQLPTV